MEILPIPCPQCGHQLQLPDRSLLGRPARCPQCEHKFLLEERVEPQPADALSLQLDSHALDGLADSMAEPSACPEPILREFGRYHLLRELGQGDMGAVFLARDVQLDRQVALKIPKFRGNDDPEMLQRFYREARSAAKLRHPNICPVFDVGEVKGTHYLTMSYIEGRTLSHYVNRKNPLPERQVVGIIRKLASALDHAHQQGVVHRDLKPANIMIDKRNDPIVMDFGLARQFEAINNKLTQTGTILGTPAYMPPEQVRAESDRIGPQSDIYSLGVVLYELLTGDVPFDGTVCAVMAMVLSQPPQKPSALRRDLNPRLEAICLQMIAKEIGDRFDSMRAVDSALAGYLKSPKKIALRRKSAEPASAASPPTAERKSKNSAGPPPRTVADVVGPVEQQPQVEGQLVAKNDGEDHSVVAHLVEHLQNEPFWKRWLIGGLAVFFVALVVAAASITYHLYGGDETLPTKPEDGGTSVSPSSQNFAPVFLRMSDE